MVTDQSVLEQIGGALNPAALKAFLMELRRVIDSQMIPKGTSGTEQLPPGHAKIGAPVAIVAPAGGWLSNPEVAQKNREMSEALAAGNIARGFALAMQLILLFGGAV
jgi:hypothetical protein